MRKLISAFLSLACVACSRSARSRHPRTVFLLICLLAIGNAMAETKVLNGIIETKNPCSNENIKITGKTVLSINETLKKVFVYEHFFGEEKGYSVNFYGRGEFDKIKKSYEIKVNGNFDSDIGSFTSQAIDEISTINGTTPNKDKIKPMNNICIQ